MKTIRYTNYHPALAAWNPLITQAFRDFSPLLRSVVSSANSDSNHRIEWFEDESHYHARLELPGVNKESLSLDAEDGILRLTVAREADAAKTAEQTDSSESFEQVVRIPEGINTAEISATLVDGILSLTLPKAEEAKAVRVNIQ